MSERTYGTVRLAGKPGSPATWVIQAEPHVVIRLKRLFERLEKRRDATGALYLSDTPEACRELLWFMERYPLDVTPRAHLEAQAQAHVDLERAIDEVVSGRVAAAVAGLFGQLAEPLREYQRIAAALCLRAGRLLLADDVGLGKTISAIGVFTDPRTLPALVVTPTHLPPQWARAVKRFAPNLETHILKSGQPYPLPGDVGAKVARRPDIIITNYHKLDGWADVLAPRTRSVVFDEIQHLRHAGTNRYQAAKLIAGRAGFRLGLSATPIYNYGGEIFNVVDVLAPGDLGTRDEFIREWCSTDRGEDKPKIRDPKAFGLYLRGQGMMLRRTRAEVGRELPPVTRVVHEIESDAAALDAVAGTAAELAKIILAQSGDASRIERMQAAGELDWRLRQATGIAKAPYVADFVRMMVDSGEKVVLYGWHRAVYDLWAERLRDLTPVFYTGSESVKQKEHALDVFRRGGTPVFIISLRAGEGLDGLQQISRCVVHGELDWSPAVHEQNEGRVARDGQSDPCMIYYLTSGVGSDPVVLDVLSVKTGQITGLRDPNAPLVTTSEVDPDHIKKLARAYLAKGAR